MENSGGLLSDYGDYIWCLEDFEEFQETQGYYTTLWGVVNSCDGLWRTIDRIWSTVGDLFTRSRNVLLGNKDL